MTGYVVVWHRANLLLASGAAASWWRACGYTPDGRCFPLVAYTPIDARDWYELLSF